MNRLTVLGMFSWQYLLMAFLACLGIVQMAAARSGRRHLWLLPGRRETAAAGLVLLVVGIAFFYLIPLGTAGPWGPSVDGTTSWATAYPEAVPGARNVNDTAGGLSGHWQALWFAIGWVGAVYAARTTGRFRARISQGEQPPGGRPQRRVGASRKVGL